MYTVSALFDRIDDAYNAVRALQDAGYRRDDISLISRDADNEYSRYIGTSEPVGEVAEDAAGGAAAGAGVGAVLGGLGGLLVGLGALAIPGVGPIIAAGPLAAALAGAGIGAAAGGLLGALTDLGVPEEQANVYAEGVRRGGTLVVVRTEDNLADQAVSVLNRYNPVNVEDRATSWRGENWTRFDDTVGPYTGRTHSTGQYDTGMADADPGPLYTTGSMTSGMAGGDQYDSVIGTEDYSRLGNEWSMAEPRFQQHYSTNYGSMGREYSYYRPAYAFGYEMANNPRYSGYDWYRFEPEARVEWERTHGDTLWDDVKDAVRNAWESITR